MRKSALGVMSANGRMNPQAGPQMPRGALLAAAGLVLFALVAVGTARITGMGARRMPDPAAIQTRELRFEDRADGAIAVYEADGALLDVLVPGTDGFVRVALRGLARERMRHGVGREPTFRLTRWADHRFTLDDPTTGRRIDLDAFGKVNGDAFARLLAARERKP